MKSEREIPLVHPFVPPAEDLQPYLTKISRLGILTNGGSIHKELEEALCRYLGIPNISLFSSGTLALTLALKALNLKGEVITTPFTSPATLQAIHWNKLTPVFADINENDLNLDPGQVEKTINENTCAILPVHIFGNPCAVDTFDTLFEKYNLPVIYDAAHCFGVEINGNSLCNFGKLSVLSFHATKVFNTIEGGAVICDDSKTKQQLEVLKNTGIDKNHNVSAFGLNAKMNELQAAWGLTNLRYMPEVERKREKAFNIYSGYLSKILGVKLIEKKQGVKPNHAFLPVLIDFEEFGMGRDELHKKLLERNIISRPYFSPLLSESGVFSVFKKAELPIAQSVASQILCLPLFHDIQMEQIIQVVETIQEIQSKAMASKNNSLPQPNIQHV